MLPELLLQLVSTGQYMKTNNLLGVIASKLVQKPNFYSAREEGFLYRFRWQDQKMK
jgi:hypothetical protein